MKHIVTFIALGAILFAKVPPLSFVALEKNVWHIVACNNEDRCRTIQTKLEPRTYDYNFANGDVVYVASDKSVRLVHDQNETILLQSQKDAFTEPSFLSADTIMLVKLINGNSKKTKIITLDTLHRKQHVLHSQYSTALEPYSNNGKDIYYANVSCVEGCGKIIQEIWHKNMITKEAEQITLLNTLSHQPHTDKSNKLIYFSSYDNGNYHIWVHNNISHTNKALTSGDVTDGFPSAYDDGILFIRRIGSTTTVNTLDKNGTIRQVPFIKGYQKIRNLKVKQ